MERVERVVVQRAGVGAALGELAAFVRAQRVLRDAVRGRVGDAVGRAPCVVRVVERTDAVGIEVRDVVELRARRLHGGNVGAVLLERCEPGANLRRAQRALAPIEQRGLSAIAIALRAFGGDLLAQRRERLQRGARLGRVAALLQFQLAQLLQRCVLVRALRADVLAHGVVEALQRAQRGVFFGSAAERLRERARDVARAAAVERDRALAHACRLQEHVERDLQVRFAGAERLAVADARGRVGAACVVDAHAFGVVVERAVHFPHCAVRRLVRQPARVRGAAGPRPPPFFLAAPKTVERRDERRRERRLAGLVAPDDDVEPRPERERPVGEPAEALDAQRPQPHGARFPAEKAATVQRRAARASGSPPAASASRSATARPRTLGSCAMAA